MDFLFWFFVAFVIYVYAGYPLIVLILSKARRSPAMHRTGMPLEVSIIIAAYNEEQIIARKIENCLLLDYPSDKLEVIVASDGSTDGTNRIVERYKSRDVRLVTLNRNEGKSRAQNQGAAASRGEILLFTDANVMLRPDAVQKIVRHFAEETVGCVVGQVTYSNEGETSVSQGEGIYWRYELLLRQKESELGNFAMGSGPIMALRRELFRPLDPDVGEDFVLPMQASMRGYRVVYEPEAISEEILFQKTPGSMFSSKVRIISKDLRGLWQCRAILNPFRYPLYAWGLISHKLLRWLVPYFLAVILLLNLLLLRYPFYRLTLALQILFYGLAAIGYVWQKKGRPPHMFSIPFSFCLVNAAALVGVAQFAMGRRSGRWVPVR